MTHLRSVAGLLTLFALSLFLAEGIGTAACPPDSGEAGIATLAERAVGDAVAHPHATDAADSGEDAGCPLGAIAIGGCVSAAVLSASPATLPTSDAGAGSSLPIEHRPDLLLSSGLFRPPRA